MAANDLTVKSENWITQRARLLRQKQTQAEEVLWQVLRDRKTGPKFIRQKPFCVMHMSNPHVFVVDFYSRAWRLAVEVDGGIHKCREAYDMLRTSLLEQQHGLRVARFANEVVLNNLSEVLIQIRNCRPISSSSLPLSAQGEGTEG